MGESRIGMIELQDDDESQVSIDDQVLGTNDAGSGTRGKVALSACSVDGLWEPVVGWSARGFAA